MNEWVKLPLVGYIEIAQRAGVQRHTVTSWRERHEDFPEPVEELRIGPVWSWPDVEEWLKSTGREYDVNLPIEKVHASRNEWRRENGYPMGSEAFSRGDRASGEVS